MRMLTHYIFIAEKKDYDFDISLHSITVFKSHGFFLLFCCCCCCFVLFFFLHVFHWVYIIFVLNIFMHSYIYAPKITCFICHDFKVNRLKLTQNFKSRKIYINKIELSCIKTFIFVYELFLTSYL